MTSDARWIPLPTDVAYGALVEPTERDPRLRPDAQAVSAFATENGWEYFLHATEQPLPGVVFRDATGRSRFLQRAADIVRAPGAAGLEVGNSAYTYTVQMNQISAEWGYAAVRLPRVVPALIVETRSARAERPLPALPDLAPRAIGVDSDRAALYVAPENAGWAQTVVTAEIVGLLDQEGLPLDLEISEGWVFLYRPGRLAVPDPLVWRRVLGILDAVGRSLEAAATTEDPELASPAVLPMRERVAQTTRHATTTYLAVVGGLVVVLTIGAYLFFGR